MTKLSVNLNKVALLRNSRGRDYPNLAYFAEKCISNGAHGITIHPRPDQRHAKYADVYELAELVSDHDGIELNIEGNPADEFLNVVLDAKPHQCTLVPDSPDQLTSDHGWDVIAESKRLGKIIKTLREEGIRVSIFLDPDVTQIEPAADTGTDRIELYTESYAQSYAEGIYHETLKKYADAAARAQQAGLEVNAGHDLDLNNLREFLSIPGIKEVSIGHALTVEALEQGWQAVIRAYLDILNNN